MSRCNVGLYSCLLSAEGKTAKTPTTPRKVKGKTAKGKAATTPTTPRRKTATSRAATSAATPTLTPEKTALISPATQKRKVEEPGQVEEQGQVDGTAPACLPGFPGQDASAVIYFFLQEHRPLRGPGNVKSIIQRGKPLTQLLLGKKAVAQATPSKFKGSEVMAMQVLNTLLDAGWTIEDVQGARQILLDGPSSLAD